MKNQSPSFPHLTQTPFPLPLHHLCQSANYIRIELQHSYYMLMNRKQQANRNSNIPEYVHDIYLSIEHFIIFPLIRSTESCAILLFQLCVGVCA